MSENEIRVLYVQPGKYPEERTIPNTLRALQELVGGDIECCRPWRDSVCVICNDSGKIDGLPPNRLYGHTDFLAGSFVVCGNGGEDFISLTDRQVFLYERLYHNPVVFLPTPHGLLPMKCTPEQYEQFQRDGNKLKIKTVRGAKVLGKKTGNYLKSIKRGKVYEYDGAQAVRVYSTAPHAHLIEEGHRMVLHDGTEVGFVPGHHVFEVAAKGFEPQYLEDVDKMLDEAVKL